MVDSTKACESDFMTSDLVNASPTKKGVIVGGGEYVKDKFGERLQIQVTLDKKLKIWKPNRESCKNLREVCGKDTESWVGQTVALTLVSTPKGLSIIGVPEPSIPKPIPVVNTQFVDPEEDKNPAL